MLWYYIQLGIGFANMLMLIMNVSKQELEKLKSFQVTILYTLFMFLQMVAMTANTISMNRRKFGWICDNLRSFKQLKEAECFDWYIINQPLQDQECVSY